MNIRSPYSILFVFFLLVCINVSGREPENSSHHIFETNKGQWPEQVQFKTDLNSGRLFLEANRFTFVYYNPADLDGAHHQAGLENVSSLPNPDATVHCHAYKVEFVGATSSPVVQGKIKKAGHVNYFIGNDPARWASHANRYEQVMYTDLYPAVDMLVYSQEGNLKYDFIVKDPAQHNRIRLSYEGVDGMALVNGDLLLKTSVNEIIEQRPYAYQVVNGEKKEVRCRYVLEKNIVSFDLLSSYDPAIPLVIDPALIVSTYAGSTLVTWGFCATYDDYGNIFTGGLSFGVGYPVTTGAFDVTFSGGVDIGISKMNPAGSALVYATYLGGGNKDYPHSLVVNRRDELCVFGSSSSTDYPVSTGCYDATFNGGASDIVISHLDSAGSALVGSTYVGGNDSDAYNNITANIGDEFKGEIVTDSSGHIYVASCSNSLNFPVTPDARAHAGGQDAVFFQLNSNCSALLWSTCLGGANDDAGYGIKRHPSGDVIVTGGSRSPDFPFTVGSYSIVQSGGFLARISPVTALLKVSTSLSTGLGQSFFVDLDESNNIYILGQAYASIPITTGVYGNPGGKTFIAKFNDNLTTLAFQTIIGPSSIGKGIAPTAFMVDYCGNIYFSGFSNASGYPISPDALYSGTNVGNFYLCVLGADASVLKHGTFLPGEHVDGGTSRYDKKGVVYQAVCQGLGPFPTTPGSYCPNLLTSRDICVLKIDFQVARAVANATLSPASTGCQPFEVNFSNHSNASSFLWNFDDGTPSTALQNPVHLFTDTGNFRVSLVAIDSASCNITDTTFLDIHVNAGLMHHPNVDTVLCDLPSIQLTPLFAGTGLSYGWNNNSTSQSMVTSVPGTYWVDISNGTCATRDSFIVHQLLLPELGSDTSLCEGQSILLDPGSNGSSYLWSTGDTGVTLLAGEDTLYWVEVSKFNCRYRDTMNLSLLEMPVVDLGPDTVLCPFTIPAVTLQAGNSPGIVAWSTGENSRQIIAFAEGLYSVEVTNAQCKATDTIEITVANSRIVAQDDTYFCDFTRAFLDSKVNDVNYLWNTGDTTKTIFIKHPGEYWYRISYHSCTESDSVEVTGVYGEDILFVPSAFTPDANGINDIFIPEGSDVLQFEMHIFNRWGNLVFRTESLDYGWDGKYESNPVEGGVFAYVLEYKTRCSDETRKKSGTFLLVK